jgi:glycosyltransferase involved in cell wall biosynthesis
MKHAVVVRDARYPIGGFETWVESIAAALPKRGVRVSVLRPTSDDAALEVLTELQHRAAAGETGVVFTLGYPYLGVVGINLIGSPWTPLPVLHGRDEGLLDWIAVGPPPKIVAPASDFAKRVETLLATKVGRFRTRGRVIVIPHGVPVPAGVPKLERDASLPLHVAVVSRFEHDVKRAMDYAAIVERAAGLPLRFTFVGDGGALRELREAVGDRATFTGALSREEAMQVLLEAHVFLSTSSSEAFGLAVAEALAAGCAVIAADAGPAFREFVEDGGGAIVPVGAIDAFVDELARLTSNLPRVREAGKQGRALVAQRYSIDAMADAYAELIRRFPDRPNVRWTPPMFRSPSDAIPRTLGARVANWLRALREAWS